jgi:hypothetical protein
MERVEVKLHAFFTLVLYEGEWSALHYSRFTPGIHWTGGLMGPRVCLEAVTKTKNHVPTDHFTGCGILGQN